MDPAYAATGASVATACSTRPVLISRWAWEWMAHTAGPGSLSRAPSSVAAAPWLRQPRSSPIVAKIREANTWVHPVNAWLPSSRDSSMAWSAALIPASMSAVQPDSSVRAINR